LNKEIFYTYIFLDVSGIVTDVEKMIKFLEHTRVPPSHFMSNVEQIVEIASKSNMELYFIEAPYGEHVDDHRPLFLVPPEFTDKISTIDKLYGNILKETVMIYPRVHLVSFEDIRFDRSLMMKDRVNPTEKEYDLIAQRLVLRMSENSSFFRK
jgi:lysophospholipase L1-like esterase